MATLARRLHLDDAITIGLGSMIGAGVFSVWGPAAAAAGSWLPAALLLAAGVAFCNATSSAQLAARYPTSGGSYAYGREVLGPWWGFLAGWGFVIGKTASCAVMALTAAAYLVPSAWQRPLAAVLVLAVAAVNLRGVNRTALATRVIVAVVAAVLLGFVALSAGAPAALEATPMPTGYGIAQAAGLIFFAFAGYARIATLGEEVVEPRRTIPRAIVAALAITVAVYLLVATSVVRVLGLDRLAQSGAPVRDAVERFAPQLVPLIAAAAAVAAIGALLALLAGLSRTVLAMSREGDLPLVLSAVHPRFQVPHRAELILAVVVAGLTLTTDLRSVIGFSSFGVLLYYFVTNVAAFRQDEDRRYPRPVQVLGMIGCLGLVITLPASAVLTGLGCYLVGIAYRFVRLSRSSP